MQVITYELALRALNEAVATRGPQWIDPNSNNNWGTSGGCANVSLTGEPECIVGTALVWLGVPPEWFLKHDRRCSSALTILPQLERDRIMLFEERAARLFEWTQAKQDTGCEWGSALVYAYLGDAEFSQLIVPPGPNEN